ncbi:hypothetical protein PTI45_03209 [Paenibacillus nuruki]|uniref:Uncharacterized protein n=1 Tax=Paenibacillus nuruki TaxID=1886670 RepID=A0A1E3L176_9BACL|nr:hypothetical protein [Paenibacillus nuruki]ODP27403.1 hypothetical protein PTI45_03209 [Paenibacillus nuruki]
MNLKEENSDIDKRVLKGEQVPCPYCGEILIYQSMETGKHPAIICSNGDYCVLLEIKRSSILDDLGLTKRKSKN